MINLRSIAGYYFKTQNHFMKIKFLSVATFAVLLSFFFSGCKKDNNATDYGSELSSQSDDHSQFSNETDAVVDEINIALEASASFSGRGNNIQFICDATIVLDTVSNPRVITITYLGTNCLGNRKRTGVVVISMAQGVQWKNAGAVVNIDFQNLKITRLSDNKSITINGTHTYTNVSGGLLINLATLNSITHTLTSTGMSITFDNGSQRNWQVSQQRVFTYNNGGVVSTTGLHSQGGTTGIAVWGTNRFGNPFTCVISQPLIIRQDCNFRLVSGQLLHDNPLVDATTTFGLDSNGNTTSCPGSGNYFMKIEWTGPGGNSHSVLLPY